MMGTTRNVGRPGSRALLLAIVFAGTAVWGWVSPAAASEIECEDIDLRLDIRATEAPTCWRSFGGDGNFRIEIQSIEQMSGDRLIVVELQRAMRRGSFYRPTLEDAVEILFWTDVVDADWGTGISHPDYMARQLSLTFDDGDTLPCFGFADASMGPYGGAKRIIYGLVCNLNGLAFSEGEAAEILAGIHE
jgi:hypothetical protein